MVSADLEENHDTIYTINIKQSLGLYDSLGKKSADDDTSFMTVSPSILSGNMTTAAGTCTKIADSNENESTSAPFCCLEGCITCTVASILFVLVVPAGILLTLYAYNISSAKFLALGISLISLPFLSVPIFIAIVLNRSRLRKISREHSRESLKNIS